MLICPFWRMNRKKKSIYLTQINVSNALEIAELFCQGDSEGIFGKNKPNVFQPGGPGQIMPTT